jgi:hypothetical protein
MQTVDLSPLVKIWTSAIKAAEEAKSGFTKTGEICETFFTGSMDAMWNDGFRTRFLGGLPSPQFKLTLNKTFELTSIVGPTLMWDYAGRTIRNYSDLEIDPMIFPVLQGMDPSTPEAQQMAQQFGMQQQTERVIADTANKLMERYLNYSQREQPGGGLLSASRIAILDALIKGRGVIKIDTYTPPGADYELTGAFRVDVDDLFIDPNCKAGDLSDAKWIAIRHVDHHWEVERKFKWPTGSLKGKGASAMSLMGSQVKKLGKSLKDKPRSINDLVIWYEVFSLCGMGTRFNGAGNQDLHKAFEESVGDEAYICFSPGVNELLNFRNAEASIAEMEQLKAKLDWPIPYHKDNRWPIACLDFWDNPRSCWPIALVSAGLGQLTIMNIILCSIADRCYRDSLDKFAISQVLDDDARGKLLSLRHEVITINPAAGEKIDQFLSYVQRPALNFDVWRIIDQMSMSFDKAVGLMELMYGLNPGGKVSRTAADANIKGDAVGVRPEFMGIRTKEWQSNIANIERIAAGYTVQGRSLKPLLTDIGSQLWDQLITAADPIVWMRDMRAMVEADSIRRPNKTRDAQNAQQMASFYLPVAQWYAGQTGNTEPINQIIKTTGHSLELNTSEWMLPVVEKQGPSPEEVAMQQEMQAANMAKLKGSADKLKLHNAEKAHQLLSNGIGLTPEQAQELEFDESDNEPEGAGEFEPFLQPQE